MNNRTLIIAEAGVNHNGDIALAKQLIERAAEAGADLVKFQTFKADRQVTRTAEKAVYQTQTTSAEESQHEMLRRLELNAEMHHELIAHCALHNIGFFSTGFDIESIDLLVGLGQDIFKIPSGELTNLPYLRHIGSLGKTVILSTGMARLNPPSKRLKKQVRRESISLYYTAQPNTLRQWRKSICVLCRACKPPSG
jgi:N,N'-diacetyllegionaminate synthase